MRTPAALLAIAAAALPAAAVAHGPCGCLAPAAGPPGTRVTVDYPLYKVVFNPDRSDLAIGPEGLWKRHRDGPRATVLQRGFRYSDLPLPTGRSFVVPPAGPGSYLVALYDGGERGQHYSWETFTVTAAAGSSLGQIAGAALRGDR